MKNYTALFRVLIACAALVIILAGIKQATEIVIPFLLSLFIAIICSPIVNFMTKRRIPRGIAIILLFCLILIAFFFLVGLINGTIREFTLSIPQYKILLSNRLNDIWAFAQRFNIPLHISPKTIVDNFDPSIVMNFVSKLLLGFSGVVTNVFVLLLVVIFMLFEAPTAKHKFAVALSANSQHIEAQEYYIERVLKGVIGYLGVKTLTSAITGILIYVLLKITGVQYAILWATLSFLFNYIPNIGSILASIPIIFQALLLNGFSIGFFVTIGVVAINMIVGNILEPKLMGKKLGLSTLVVFLSLLFWGWLLGTVGMLLSVPLTMALKIALEASPNTTKYALLLGDISKKVN